MGKHRKRKSRYVGRHRATYVSPTLNSRKATGVLAVSAILTLSPAILGYRVVENSIVSGMSVTPPSFLEEILRGVIPDPAPEQPAPVELYAP